jgi:hypothetical protein
MADLVFAPTQFRFAIAEEATFSTAITAQTSFQELLINEPTQIDYSNLIVDRAKKADGKRVMSHTDNYVSKLGSDYSVTVSGIATDTTLDYLIYGVMQDLGGEATTSPYLKTFEWDGSSGAVDFSVGAGISYTLNGFNPGSAEDESWQLRGCILSELTLTADPGTNGGRLSYSATFMSGFVPIQTGITVNPASWVNAAADYYPFQTLDTKTISGNNVVLGSLSLTFNNAATRVGFDSSGNTQNYSLGVGGDGLSITGEISVKYDDITSDEINTFLADPTLGSAEVPIVIQWGDGTADGTLKFDVNAIYTGNALDFGNDAGVFVTLPFMGVDDSVTTQANEAIEVTIVNEILRGW